MLEKTRSRLLRALSRLPRAFVRRVVKETVKESRVNRRAFQRDALTAAQFYYLEGLARDGSEVGIHQGDPRDREIIVSLTSIRDRLFDITTTIESLLRQTLKPDRIILWLDQAKIQELDLPLMLRSQRERGLSIRFCEDIGPHTKLIPVLRQYPDATVITVDDDILYPSNLVERLVYNHKQRPTEILCLRARRILMPTFGGTNYAEHWPNFLAEGAGLHIVPLGVGGVLYPPRCLDPEVFNLEAQRELAPRADDVWFKAMSLKAGTVCRRIQAPLEPHPIRPNSQDVSLDAYNVGQNGNDVQIQATFNRYGLWDVLKRSGDVLTLPPS